MDLQSHSRQETPTATFTMSAATIGMAVPVAGAPTVCYGGYVSGGGHSITGARYGLGADQVIDMTVVTPDGKVLTANAYKNKDLFWALRGGGGATFGVIINMTMLLNPDLPTVEMIWGAVDITPNATHFWDATLYAFTQYPDLIDQGLAGQALITPATGGNSNANFSVQWMGFNLTLAEVSAMLLPIEQYLNATWPGEFNFGSPNVTQWPSYYAYWKANPDNTTPIGIDVVLGSRLLGRDALSNPNLKEYLMAATSSSGLNLFMTAGPGVHNKPLELDSVNPAWRKTYSHTLAGVGWIPLNSTMEAQVLQNLADYQAALTTLAPDTGAYVNEGNPFQPNYHEAFWGRNYQRLLAIKRAVDPEDVFWCRSCVGNERWQEVGNELCQM
jgi:hypothetical protein